MHLQAASATERKVRKRRKYCQRGRAIVIALLVEHYRAERACMVGRRRRSTRRRLGSGSSTDIVR